MYETNYQLGTNSATNPNYNGDGQLDPTACRRLSSDERDAKTVRITAPAISPVRCLPRVVTRFLVVRCYTAEQSVFITSNARWQTNELLRLTVHRCTHTESSIENMWIVAGGGSLPTEQILRRTYSAINGSLVGRPMPL
eukprot:Gb_28611 [translate_table: standard]